MSGGDMAPGEIVHLLAEHSAPSANGTCTLCGERDDRVESHAPTCVWRLAHEWNVVVSAAMRDAGIRDRCPHCDRPLP